MSTLKADNAQESTAGAGFTITGRKVGKPPGSTGAGVVDDYSALNTALAGFSSGDVYELGAGTYLLNSNLTISCGFRPLPGAKLKPATGKTVTISGPVEAGLWQWMDFSGGGSFVFTSLRVFEAEWFGIVGDGVTDDAPAMNNMAATIPDYSRVYFRRKMVVALYSTWTLSDRQGVHFYSDVPSRPDNLGVTFIWRGAYLGTMVSWNRTDNCYMERFGWKPNDGCATSLAGTITNGSKNLVFTGFAPLTLGMQGSKVIVTGAGVGGADLVTTLDTFTDAAHGVLHDAASTTVGPTRVIIGASATSGPPLTVHDIDITGVGVNISTSCHFIDNNADSFGFVPGQAMWRVSNVSRSNCESFVWLGNKVNGWFPCDATANEGSMTVSTNGTSTITFSSPWPLQNFIGGTISIPDANGVGVPYVGVITGVGGSTDGNTPPRYTQATVSPAPSATVSGKRAIVDDVQGYAIHIGASSNSMNHFVGPDNIFTNLAKAIWVEGGSLNWDCPGFEFNAIDLQIDSSSTSIQLSRASSEAARQHLVLTNAGPNSPITMIAGRLGTTNVKVNGRFCDLKKTSTGSVSTFTSIGTQFDDQLTNASINAGDAFYWGMGGGKFIIVGTHYGSGTGTSTTLAGYNDMGDAFLTSIDEDFFTDNMPVSFVKSGATVADFVGHGVFSAFQAISARRNTPSDSGIQNAQYVPFEDTTGALNFRRRRNDGSYQTVGVRYPQGSVALTDGATIAVDASLGQYFYVDLGGNRTIQQPTNPLDGQVIHFELKNNTAGAITTTWASGYSTNGAGMWTDPATGKVKTISFVYKGAWSTWVQQGAASQDQAW